MFFGIFWTGPMKIAQSGALHITIALAVVNCLEHFSPPEFS